MISTAQLGDTIVRHLLECRVHSCSLAACRHPTARTCCGQVGGDIRQQLLVAIVQKLSGHSGGVVGGARLHSSGYGRAKGLFGTEGWM